MLVDANHAVAAELVLAVDQQVQWQAHREVGLERGVHRDERALGSLVQGRGGGEHAVQDGLAVLALAHLEEAGLARGLDEVAGRIDQEHAHGLALDLPAEDHAGVEVDARGAQRGAVLVVHAAHGAAQHARGPSTPLLVQQRGGVNLSVVAMLVARGQGPSLRAAWPHPNVCWRAPHERGAGCRQALAGARPAARGSRAAQPRHRASEYDMPAVLKSLQQQLHPLGLQNSPAAACAHARCSSRDPSGAL